jgi:hypothetical protein
MERLTRKKTIRPTSSLLSLTPFMNDEGVLRLAGQLSRAKLPYDVLHSPILPGKHPLARMIIQAFHESMHHIGTFCWHTYASILDHFRTRGGETHPQRLCSLSPFQTEGCAADDVNRARFGAGHPPFTFTAVDYFGLIDFIPGRGSAMRWGVLSPAWCMWICQNTLGRRLPDDVETFRLDLPEAGSHVF